MEKYLTLLPCLIYVIIMDPSGQQHKDAKDVDGIPEAEHLKMINQRGEQDTKNVSK